MECQWKYRIEDPFFNFWLGVQRRELQQADLSAPTHGYTAHEKSHTQTNNLLWLVHRKEFSALNANLT